MQDTPKRERVVKGGKLEPPSKGLKFDHSENEMDKKEYKEAVNALKKEWRKGKKNRDHAVIKNLMDTTFATRRKWIYEERPLVVEVLKSFPPLTSTNAVSFCV